MEKPERQRWKDALGYQEASRRVQESFWRGEGGRGWHLYRTNEIETQKFFFVAIIKTLLYPKLV